MSTRKTTLFYGVLIAVASLAVGMVIASRLDLTPASSAQMVAMPAMNSTPLGGIPIDATTFRTIAKQQIPTVVNIRTESRQRTQDLTEFFGGQGGDDWLRRFFGGQAPPDSQQQPQQRPRRRQQSPQGQLTEGAGTGFVIDKSGYILTNNHVVEGADKITVAFVGATRNEEYSAKVVGHDALTDSALIQLTELPSTPLQEAKFGDSSQMQQGDWVMAIGNPFNLGHTVTVGVISALDRPFGGTATRQQPMIQTDAAINPGNSGGPLLNVRGEVIGMNTAIYTDAQRAANIGIGFATPINTIRELLPQLRSGKISRGNITHPGFEHIQMEVMVQTMQPQQIFSFTWHPYATDPKIDYSKEPSTLVEFRLEKTGTGTLLTVTESGFDKIPADRRFEAFRKNEGGWTQQLENIEAYVTQKP